MSYSDFFVREIKSKEITPPGNPERETKFIGCDISEPKEEEVEPNNKKKR